MGKRGILAKLKQTFGFIAIAALLVAVPCELFGSILGVTWLRALATVALFAFTICLPLKLLRTPVAEHHRFLPLLLVGAIVAMACPSQIYLEAGLLKAGPTIVTSWLDCVYFSAATWCSVDCGGIAPTPSGRWIVVCHALLGYAYLAFLIAFVELHVTAIRERGQRR